MKNEPEAPPPLLYYRTMEEIKAWQAVPVKDKLEWLETAQEQNLTIPVPSTLTQLSLWTGYIYIL